MACHDNLWDCAHTYGIRTHAVVHLVLGRGLKRGSLHTYIHSMYHVYALFAGYFVGLGYQFAVVRFVHVGEAGACGEVLSAQRMLRKEVDMVGYDHEIANLEGRVHAAGSVAYKQRVDAQLIHNAYGKGYLLHGISLVIVETPLHSHHVLASKLAEYELAGMAFDCGNGEVGDFGIRESVGVSDF